MTTAIRLTGYAPPKDDTRENMFDPAFIITIPKHGGGDPDGHNRARTGRGIDMLQPYGNKADEDDLCDAIADLMHGAHSLGLDFAAILRRACSHFQQETTP